jgi:hypothetical protein
MRLDSPLERTILECECKEKLVIFGSEHDWRSRNPVFRCKCGEKLTLANKYDGEEEFLDAGCLKGRERSGRGH